MIVSCPSCGTLYRYAAISAGARARCSCCDGSVSVASRRQYAVVAAPRAETLVASADLSRAPHPFRVDVPVSTPHRVAAAAMIGMDDPALAPRLARSALDAGPAGGSGAAMTWAVLAEGAPASSPSGSMPTERSVPPVPGSEMREARRISRRLPERDNIVLRDDEGALRPVLVGVALGALAGIAGSAWFGGSAVSWWAGGALAGAVVVLGIRRSWTSRNE